MESERDEAIRKVLTESINIRQREREQLEEHYGKVWDTSEMTEEFTVHGFLAPFVSVTRKSDGKKGMLTFQHQPRFFFAWQEQE